MSVNTVVGFKHDQSTPSSTWVINHGLGTDAPIVDYWIIIGGALIKALPISVIVDNSGQVTATWSSPQSGVAYVA